MLLIKSRLALRVQSMQGVGWGRHAGRQGGMRNINKLLPGFVMETLRETEMSERCESRVGDGGPAQNKYLPSPGNCM